MGTVGKLGKSEDENVEGNLDVKGEKRKLKDILIEMWGEETRCGEMCKKKVGRWI